MNTLHNLQQQFVTAIQGESAIDDATNTQGKVFSVENEITDGALSRKRRLNIYRNNVNISLRDALKSIYPVTNRLVGDDFFKLMAYEYIKQHPSRSGNLHDFGHQLAEFIAGFTPAAELVYLADIAKLEWAYHKVFHAANSPVFDIEQLQKVPPTDYGELFFKLSPACALIKSSYPILRIWQSNQQEQNPGKSQSDKPELISLDEGGDLLLVARVDLDIHFQLLNACEYNFLQALQENNNFFNACDAASRAQADCDVGEIFQKFILYKTIVDFEVSNGKQFT